jgi:hypothetical protein
MVLLLMIHCVTKSWFQLYSMWCTFQLSISRTSIERRNKYPRMMYLLTMPDFSHDLWQYENSSSKLAAWVDSSSQLAAWVDSSSKLAAWVDTSSQLAAWVDNSSQLAALRRYCAPFQASTVHHKGRFFGGIFKVLIMFHPPPLSSRAMLVKTPNWEPVLLPSASVVRYIHLRKFYRWRPAKSHAWQGSVI